MTSPLRRKRPITRRSSKALTPISGGSVVALSSLTLLLTSPAHAAELQWRRAAVSASAATRIAAAGAKPQAAGKDGAEDAGRSVVVRRAAGRSAPAAAPFDPFDAELTNSDAAMRATEPADGSAFDPFDETETTDPAATSGAEGEAAESSAAEVERAFEEPEAAEPGFVSQPPTAAEELEQAHEAIDREMMRREAEAGAVEEMATPEAPADDEDAADDVPQMEDELAAPGLVEGEDMDEGVLDEDELDLEMQFGAEGLPEEELTPEQLEAHRQQLEQERMLQAEECEALYDAVRADSIKNISLDIRLRGTPGDDFPFECTGRHAPFQPRAWAQTTYLWKASGLCHKPLYFEQVQLERYGHDWGPVLQPFVSGAHFFATVPILPYKMGLQTPQECVYTLGYYRPGSCAPYMIQPLGFTWRAAAFQAGVATGAAAAIP
jgi:hypothetical protein